VHSLSDFNLQIPANAALFYVFCALATGSPTTAETSTSGGIRVYPGEPLIESLL